MATVSATLTFSLPEDVDSDQLLIYSSTTKTGTYSLVATVSYEYGTISYELDTLDTTKWYKVKFNNSVDAEAGPLSDAVYGGDFDKASPFLAVSTTTDGANYATVNDVYDYANLTTQDVTSSKISKALKRARAVIDLRTAELDLDRFSLWSTEVARKKYNATLRILREAEINIALGHLYRGLADDDVIQRLRDSNTLGGGAVSIGATSIADDNERDTANTVELNRIGNRYLTIGAAMLTQLQPSSIRLTDQDPSGTRFPRFKYPFNGYKY